MKRFRVLLATVLASLSVGAVLPTVSMANPLPASVAQNWCQTLPYGGETMDQAAKSMLGPSAYQRVFTRGEDHGTYYTFRVRYMAYPNNPPNYSVFYGAWFNCTVGGHGGSPYYVLDTFSFQRAPHYSVFVNTIAQPNILNVYDPYCNSYSPFQCWANY